MGAIGNYIHLKAENYLNHGVSKSKKATFKRWHSQTATIKNKALQNKSALTKEDKENIKNTLEALMNRSQAPDSSYYKVQKEVERILNQKFGSSLQTLNWNTGGMVWGNNQKNDVLGKIKRHYNENQQLVVDIEKTIKKLEDLERIVDFKKRDQNSKTLKRDLTNIKNICKELKNIQEANLINQGWKNKKEAVVDYEIIKNINYYIEQYAAYPAINLQQGDAFEAMIAMLPYIAEGTAMNELEKTIAGKKSEAVKINFSNFSPSISAELAKGNYLKVNGSTSQGKVDINLTWNNKLAKVSAKNINLGGPFPTIHLVSGSSMLFMIQDMNGNFVNHFLNLYAQHEDDRKFSSELKLLKNMIVQEMRLYLFYKALTGDVGNRTKADIFIVNDASGSGVKVISMDEIVSKIIDNDQSSLISIKTDRNERLRKNDNSFKFINDPVENNLNGSARISKLLADVHSRKLFISINANLIKSFN